MYLCPIQVPYLVSTRDILKFLGEVFCTYLLVHRGKLQKQSKFNKAFFCGAQTKMHFFLLAGAGKSPKNVILIAKMVPEPLWYSEHDSVRRGWRHQTSQKQLVASIRPELCPQVLLGILIRKMRKKRIFFYAHQSPTAPLNTMGITKAKSEKVENSNFYQKYSFIQAHISTT